MKVIIDTSSLLALVRYYLPFDHQNMLFDFVYDEIKNQNITIIDSVLKECEYFSKGLIIKRLKYLNQKEFKEQFKFPYRTKDLLAPFPKKFNNLLNSNFRTPLSKRLTEAEFEEEKDKYLKSADARMIILALKIKTDNENIAIVTEESHVENDNKTFKKIPAICKILGIQTMSLPELICSKGIEIDFNESRNLCKQQ